MNLVVKKLGNLKDNKKSLLNLVLKELNLNSFENFDSEKYESKIQKKIYSFKQKKFSFNSNIDFVSYVIYHIDGQGIIMLIIQVPNEIIKTTLNETKLTIASEFFSWILLLDPNKKIFSVVEEHKQHGTRPNGLKLTLQEEINRKMEEICEKYEVLIKEYNEHLKQEIDKIK